MSVTMQQVLAEIDKDEPNYTRAAQLGPEALPHLRQIVEADDPLRASKAAYLASLIPGPGAVEILRAAAQRREPEIRVTVAHALRNTGEATSELLAGLLDDQDSGVRKVALSSVKHLRLPALREKVARIAQHDPEAFLRSIAAETISAMDRVR